MKLKRCRRPRVSSKAKVDAEELAPEIVQVIAVVAEIMLDDRKRPALRRQISGSPE